MSRVSMRRAIGEYLRENKLTHVGEVYNARPEIMPEQAYESNIFEELVANANGSSAVLVVNLPSDVRKRQALTGRGAVNDSRIYNAVIEVYFASLGGEGVKAQEDYDGIVDEIINLIRANATLNAPEEVWSAGEYDRGVQHKQSEPYTGFDGNTVLIYGAVSFDAWEWVAESV